MPVALETLHLELNWVFQANNWVENQSCSQRSCFISYEDLLIIVVNEVWEIWKQGVMKTYDCKWAEWILCTIFSRASNKTFEFQALVQTRWLTESRSGCKWRRIQNKETDREAGGHRTDRRLKAVCLETHLPSWGSPCTGKAGRAEAGSLDSLLLLPQVRTNPAARQKNKALVKEREKKPGHTVIMDVHL